MTSLLAALCQLEKMKMEGKTTTTPRSVSDTRKMFGGGGRVSGGSGSLAGKKKCVHRQGRCITHKEKLQEVIKKEHDLAGIGLEKSSTSM